MARRKILKWLRSDKLAYIPYILLALMIVVGFGTWGSYKVRANSALREAKNVNLSLKLLNIYAQSHGEPIIFDPDSKNGLSEYAQSELPTVAAVSGTVNLTEWSYETNAPSKFTYITDRVVVVFSLSDSGDPQWVVEYRLPLIHYD